MWDKHPTRDLEVPSKELIEAIELIMKELAEKERVLITDVILYNRGKEYLLSDLEQGILFKSTSLTATAHQFISMEGLDTVLEVLR